MNIRERERSLQKEVTERKRAEEKFRESDARTRAISQRHPDMLFQFDRDGRFLDMRGDPENLIRPPPINASGGKSEHVMPGDIARMFRKQLARTFATGG
jgi:PAS domain-containing protein